MNQSFWGFVWSNFLKIQGVLLGVIGIIIGILLWLFSPKTTIPLWLFLLIAILALVLVITFASTAYELFKKSKDFLSLPKILVASKNSVTNQTIFLLEPSELFSIDAVVSFYYFDNSFEFLIAMGRVVNIQRDSKIQIEIIRVRPGYEAVVKQLENNDLTILSKTRIKPNIPRAFLDGTL